MVLFYFSSIFFSYSFAISTDNLGKTWSVGGYYEQSVYLKWQNQLEGNDLNTPYLNLGQIEGLLIPELGVVIDGNPNRKSSFFLDLSIDAQIYDIYNIQFAPTNFNIKKAYLRHKTDFSSEYLPDGIEWQIGRDKLFWGPAHNDSLILSDHISHDMFNYSGMIDLGQLEWSNDGNFYFTKIFSILDNKWLSGQRFEYSPNPQWQFGLSETTVLPENSSLLYFNPIPLPLINYITRQWSVSGDTCYQPDGRNNINYNIGLDVTWNSEKDVRLYGEILLYDLPLWGEPDSFYEKYGLTIGGQWSDILDIDGTDFTIEYSRINPEVYFSESTDLNYFFHDSALGHSLGPDADQLFMQIERQLKKDLSLKLEYKYQRHGKGGSIFNSNASNLSEINNLSFLSGVIENSQTFSTSLVYDLNKDWQIKVTGLLSNTYNKDNQMNENIQETSIITEFKYKF